MTRPVYPQQVVVRVDHDDDPTVDSAAPGRRTGESNTVVELVDTQAGPAGVSAIEFPDGTVCEVDHADPAQLVQLTVSAATSSDALAPWIGDERTVEVLDGVTRPGGPSHSDRTAEQNSSDEIARILPAARGESQREPVFSRRRRGPQDIAAQVGRMVLAADLIDDPTIDVFVRLVAGVEVLLELEDDPDVAVLAPQREHATGMVARLAPLVDDAHLQALIDDDPDPVRRATWAIRSLVERSDRSPLPLRRLLGRLDGWLEEHDETAGVLGRAAGGYQADRTMPAPASLVLDLPPLQDSAPEVEDFRQVERVEPALLRVTVSRAVDGTWVRALRADGLVLLAAAPLLDDGLLQSAELVVPPDTNDDELVIQVVDAAQIDHGPRPTELVRRAVRAGRDAARAERLGRDDLIADRWTKCAARWDDAGDTHRAALARLRADPAVAHATPVVLELLSDGLAEQLHSLDS